ncbi:MAG: hypothetical protein ACRD2N_19990 [Vicinamibacterales bacterium]
MLVAVLTTVFVAGHVLLIPETPDGIDSANFIMAVDGYNPRLHQPHPPGFPVHVALGRLVTSAYRVFTPGVDDTGTAAASLRIWSVICGTLAIFAVMWVALGLGVSASRATLVTALAISCPLFWVTAMRPLSDVPGLLFATTSQALSLAAYNNGAAARAKEAVPAVLSSFGRLEYRWLAAAFVAGVAVGLRVQTALLTVPLLTVVTLLHARRAGVAIIPQVLGALVVGVLAWLVPMTTSIGGAAEYLRLITTVASDDVQGVEMLATSPTLRLFAFALMRTFIIPWGSYALGWSAFVFTVLGAIALAKRDRRALGFTVLMGLPYLAFHLYLQETASIRYALPLVPVSCLLIVANLKWLPVRFPAAVVGCMVVAAASTSVSAATAYGRTESPIARALKDLKHEGTSHTRPPALGAHHSVGRAIRGESWPGQLLPAPVRYEWLALAATWLQGSHDTVWFLADGRRSDLALIDPAARRLIRSYRWPRSTESLLGGIQPSSVDWYEIVPPGWFLMTGWSLTPETRGVAQRSNDGPGVDGIVGYIKRRDAPAVMMIGGRNIGGPCDTAASIDVLIDGRPLATWTASSRSSFLQSIALAPGALRGEGEYATVRVIAKDAAPAGRIVDVAVEQFDVQSPGSAMAGFDGGWHMPELDPATGLKWRWIEETADVHTEAFGRDLELVIRGESPLRYFEESPHVVVRAGQFELASFRPEADFTWVVPVPAKAVGAAAGRVTIKSDRSFVPDEVSGNGDRRQLALRIYSVEIRPRPVSPAAR